MDDVEVEEETAEVDSELYEALARARRLGAMSTERRNEDFAAQRLRERLGAAERWAAEAKPHHEAVEGGTDLSALEFSETGEFCKAVRNHEEDEELPSHLYKVQKAERERQMVEEGVEGGGVGGGVGGGEGGVSHPPSGGGAESS